MQFDRLRLNGFKSFVDPTDLLIREGLTGIVGPNGCGKSNLLEALRWVMGENRPKAMRGAGMEDVIFAGTNRRPARGHAEVGLLIDNRSRLAPAGINDADTLEITRRITRDAGSVYRVNGREVRARDVQMLFADASTGAHSPALVRQGQISELINARPQARRRILEEAAGISGLYQRRHEATLKLDGAEANLARVDETLDGLAQQAAALARQARTAARYREIGAALREAEGQLLWLRWAEAEAAREAAAVALAEAVSAAAAADAAAQRATVTREAAEAALPPQREEYQIAGAVLSRAQVEREALDEAEAQAVAAIEGLRAQIAQLDRDLTREEGLNRDAAEVVARLVEEKASLDVAGEGAEERIARAEADAASASAGLRDEEVRLDALRDEAARAEARHQSAARLVADLQAMRNRSKAAADEALQARQRAEAAMASATTATEAATAARGDIQKKAAAAEAAVAAAEVARGTADAAETEARAARAAAEGEARALLAETAALEKLVSRGKGSGDALLGQVRAARGYEAALGAALGDDLRFGLADEGRAGGAGDSAGWYALPDYDAAAALPEGAEPLAPQVQAPAALQRRLLHIGVVADAATGAALQPALRPGQRLVTRAGDLWRWDGLARPSGGETSAAALHLQTVNRLAEARTATAAAEARAAEAVAAHEQARSKQAEAAATETRAREAHRGAERALSDAMRAASRAESEQSLASSRAESARNELARHQADSADIATRLADAENALAELPDSTAIREAVDQAQAAVEAARTTMLSHRDTLNGLKRDAATRATRLQEIATESGRWQARLDQAGTRSGELTARREDTAARLTEAEQVPATLATRRSRLVEAEAAGRARLERAQAALDAAEAALRDATAAEREAERVASTAREDRAAREARAEAAGTAEEQARARIREETGDTPQALAAALDIEPATLPDLAALEGRITQLRARREALGAVNLRADEDKRALEEERAALAAEKDDLEAAIRKLRAAVGSLNREGRERLLAAFETVNANFSMLFTHLFGGGEARLLMVESDDPLDAGLEIMCQPPGKKLATLSLLSGGEQTLTALALIFAVFLANPAPICVLDEVDAPLDDANVTRFCDLMDEMTRRTETRFLVITHHAVTMARMDRLFGVTMVEQGVSQLVSVDLHRAEALVA